MLQIDRIKIEILEDGTLKTTTDEVSAANHSYAEDVLSAIDLKLGGAVTIEAREGAHHHHHHHGEHEHHHH